MCFLIFYVSFTLLLLVGCSSGENGVQSDTVNENENAIESEKEEKDPKAKTDVSSNKNEEASYDDSKLIEAVETAQVFPEITFQNINWFFGRPDRQPYGGIWVYIP